VRRYIKDLISASVTVVYGTEKVGVVGRVWPLVTRPLFSST